MSFAGNFKHFFPFVNISTTATQEGLGHPQACYLKALGIFIVSSLQRTTVPGQIKSLYIFVHFYIFSWAVPPGYFCLFVQKNLDF